MTPGGILETTLYAENLDAIERFYKSVLGLPVVSREAGHHVFFRCGPGMLLVFNPSMSARPPVMGSRLPVPPHGAKGPGHVCFRAMAHEIPQWLERLRQAKVHVEADFTWPRGGRSIYFRDPAGNSLEFAEPRLWADR